MQTKKKEYPEGEIKPNYKLICADFEDPESIKELLEQGAEVTARDRMQRTPLHLAVMYGCAESVRLLLQAEAYIDEEDEDGKTAIYYALHHDTSEIARMLIEAEVNLQPGDVCREIVVAAIRWNDANFLRLVLNCRDDNMQVNVDLPTKLGLYPIFAAVHQPDPTITRLLLQRGARADKQRSRDGFTPLHLAVQLCHIQQVRVLAEFGSDVNIKTSADETPLHIAIRSFLPNIRYEMIKLLLEYRADCNKLDRKNMSAFHYALPSCDRRTIELFLKHGADLNVKVAHDLLHLTLLNPDEEMLDLLLEKGISVDAMAQDVTALYSAVAKCQIRACLLLLERGANPTFSDTSGLTPLMKLMLKPLEDKHPDDSEIAKLLIRYITKWEVSKSLIAAKDKELIQNTESLKIYHEACVWELHKMVNRNICGNVSLYHLVMADKKEIANYVKNTELANEFEKQMLNFGENFPIYFPDLMESFSGELEKLRKNTEGILDLRLRMEFVSPHHDGQSVTEPTAMETEAA